MLLDKTKATIKSLLSKEYL